MNRKEEKSDDNATFDRIDDGIQSRSSSLRSQTSEKSSIIFGMKCPNVQTVYNSAIIN